ncbi:sodium- and chloride-dependent GABA transporter 2-like [Chaetodon auriga]|uniref:sodium- and chloride-dependent GABA transporter 2-like n=1 Tax=Chaetodon auriga TaxID=39042 RepID=UPI004032FFBD
MSEETARGAPAGDPGPDKKIPEEGVHPRGKWANNKEFILSMTVSVVDLGNIFTFPYLCFRHGGGVFFIPYFVLLVFCGIPVFFLETALGQYTSEGGVTAWRKICPMFQGVGIASQVIVSYLNIYYIMILAWTIFYLYNSIKSPLPWSTCDNVWNTDLCHSHLSIFANPHLFQPDSNWSFLNNVTSPDYFEDTLLNETESLLHGSTPEKEFWTNRVLRVSDDMSVTTVHWDLALCLLLAWVMCYFCIWKGIKSTGKAVYFTATVPYLLLLIIFFRGVTLPGAGEGLRYYLIPDFHVITDPGMWYDAGMLVLYSYTTCTGVLTALGSYNKYKYNCYRDCLALCCLNSATSIFAGFVVFSVLGFMAFEMNVPIYEVAASGPGLVFMAFPRALSLLPGSSFWAVVFFLMVFFLALGSQFVRVESLATAITDLFPRHLRRRCAREILVLVITVVCFLLGLPFVTEGGIVLYHLIDSYGGSATSLLIITSVETIVIAWVYGADRFYDNIEDMIGYRPFSLLKYCWLFITPLICGLLLLFNLAHTFTLVVFGYVVGAWATAVGSLLMIIPLICIPAFILVSLYKDSQNMTTPSSDLRQAWPHKPILTLCKYVIFKAQGQPNRRADETNEKIVIEELNRV